MYQGQSRVVWWATASAAHPATPIACAIATRRVIGGAVVRIRSLRVWIERGEVRAVGRSVTVGVRADRGGAHEVFLGRAEPVEVGILGAERTGRAEPPALPAIGQAVSVQIELPALRGQRVA